MARLNEKLDAVDALPFPTVLGLFKHWNEEPPLAMSLAALAGFKSKPKEMTAAEADMLDANTKKIDIKELPPAFQAFMQKARKIGEKIHAN